MTNERTEMIDITSKVQNVIQELDVQNGICTLFIPHTTAAVTINENADPDVTRDILMMLNKTIPLKAGINILKGILQLI